MFTARTGVSQLDPAEPKYVSWRIAMKYRLAMVLVILGSAIAASGQTCESTCNQTCGPVQDVGKQRFQSCVGSCLSKCAKCTPKVGTLFPKYYVLGLVYAPPGCTGTSTQKCSSQSSVDYSSASTMGTKVSTTSSFVSNTEVTVNLGIGDPKATHFGATATGSYQDTATDTNSQTISKGTTTDIKAQGNGDGVNHDQDTFILLLDPAVAIQENPHFGGEVCSPSHSVSTYVGLSSATGTQDLLNLSVATLKALLTDPSSVNANIRQQLDALHFTNADYQTILGLDPFANTSPTLATLDPNRYGPTTITFSYEPLQNSDCNNGVCSCLSTTQSLKNELAINVDHTVQAQYKVGVVASVGGIDLGLLNLGGSVNQSFTWTSSSTKTDTTDSTQTAATTISCPGPNYSGPVEMAVYWDNLFGSFLFMPIVIASPQTLARGAVTGPSGQPLRQQAVTLTFNGKTYHTTTDHRGNFVFASLAGAPRPGAGQIQVGSVRQPVTVGSAQPIQIRVP